jgi:hypothetical protein
MRSQHQRYSASVLPHERAKAPQRIAACKSGKLDERWRVALGHLLRYVEQYGHPLVPRRYTDKQGFKLGLWVMFQRGRYRKGKLAHTRIAALEDLPGWVWNPHCDSSDRFSAIWMRGFTHLKEYIARGGHPRVPTVFVAEDGYRLGEWVNSQRTRYRKGKLAKARITALESVPGWVWDPRSEAIDRPNRSWTRGVLQLKQYLQRQGHACVPQEFVAADGFKLGVWVSYQRVRYHCGALSKARIAALESLPGWTWNATSRRGRRPSGRRPKKLRRRSAESGRR